MRLLVVLFVALVALPGCTAPGQITGPSRTFDGIRFEVDVDATHHGVVTAILWPNETPATAAFMRSLATRGYYDGREFTRVIPGFVIQQVDRTGGTTDTNETIPLEAGRNVTFSAGAIGIARGNDPNSGGPEFFIMDFANTSAALYGNYTVWAQVVEGMDIVHAIARVPSVRNPTCSLPNPDPTGTVSPCFIGVPGNPAENQQVGTFDQEAINPSKITSARFTRVTLPASAADLYPLQTSPPQVVGSTRYTLEWPHNLGAGHDSQMTWYVWNRPTNGVNDAAPDLSRASVQITGPTNATAQVKPDPADPRILHWTWNPTTTGNYTITLRDESSDLAHADVPIP